MSDLNSVELRFKYALITDDSALQKQIDADLVMVLNHASIIDKTIYRVVIIDYRFILKNKIDIGRMVKSLRTCVLIDKNSETINLKYLEKIEINQLLSYADLSMELFYHHDQFLKEDEQNQDYVRMANELNQEYEVIRNELITKLNETRFDLISSRQKILDANDRAESMRKILYAISIESTVEAIEQKLNDLLPVSTKATWIKIVPEPQAENFKDEIQEKIKTTFNYYKINTTKTNSNLVSHSLFFIKADQKPFKKDDLNLFAKIKDLIEINLNRENIFASLIVTEKIVRTAFESFIHPLAIIDENNNVVQSNVAFKKYSSGENKCYQLFFNRTTPCENCFKGTKFNQISSGLYFEIDSRSYKNEDKKTKAFIHLYRNLTEKKYLEQRINQSAQLKELGLISSSIAHELNNPIGGILSYLQLIQMDLPKTETSVRADIDKMISTTLHMKKIIEDLLIFSRPPQVRKYSNFIVSDVIADHLRLQELKLKSENIKVVDLTTDQKIEWVISKLDFKDSLHFIFNFFILRIHHFRKSNTQKTGLVEIKFSSENNSQTMKDVLSIEFSCNCGHLDEVEKAKDISLLALSKLLTDQKIILEILALKENWITIKLIIPKS